MYVYVCWGGGGGGFAVCSFADDNGPAANNAAALTPTTLPGLAGFTFSHEVLEGALHHFVREREGGQPIRMQVYLLFGEVQAWTRAKMERNTSSKSYIDTFSEAREQEKPTGKWDECKKKKRRKITIFW